MGNTITHISKVEIKGLWGRYDIEWNLSPDVNILAGINGSGKSTILNAIYTLFINIPTGQILGIDITGQLMEECKIVSNNNDFIWFKYFLRNDNPNDGVKNVYQDWAFKGYKLDVDYSYGGGIFGNKIVAHTLYKSIVYGRNSFDDLQFDYLKTFDVPLKSVEELRKTSNDLVKTDLDAQVHNLGRSYLDYQINIGKRAFEILNKNNSDTQSGVAAVKKTYDRFLQMVDDLFFPTGKKVNREKNELSFLSGEEEISAYQLSSGEKQLLLILLTVLVQDTKPSILFMDEPELSLHFDWQKKLIQYIRELNPNVQVILATHSPAIIMEGWLDKVSEVRDLIVLDRKAPTHAA